MLGSILRFHLLFLQKNYEDTIKPRTPKLLGMLLNLIRKAKDSKVIRTT